MRQELFLSDQQVEQLFHTELVKSGVDFHKAAQVAKMLATEQPDELLTEAERQLAEDACKQWLVNRNRWKSILQVLDSSL